MATRKVSGSQARKTTVSDVSKNKTDLIRTKAYQIWESRGRIQGKDLEIWLEAEKAVKG